MKIPAAFASDRCSRHEPSRLVFIGSARVERLFASGILGAIGPGEHRACAVDRRYAPDEIALSPVVSRVPIEREGSSKVTDARENLAQFSSRRHVLFFANFRIAERTHQRMTSAFGIAARRCRSSIVTQLVKRPRTHASAPFVVEFFVTSDEVPFV